MHQVYALVVLAAVIIFVDGTPPAGGSVTASFTARPIQGDVCVAPCTVHFDAVGLGLLSTPTPFVSAETTDSVYDNEFHTIGFYWTFGDNTASSCGGVDAVWEHSGMSKNRAIGGIAGHTYCAPGVYTVTLSVVNPAGDVDAEQRTVTVTDPEDAFTDALTYCVANAGGAVWSGCPIAEVDNTCLSDNCLIDNNLDRILISGDNCVGIMDCANTDAQKVRIYFKRGDTFTCSFCGHILPGSQAGPGLITAFGSGAQPIFNFTSGEFRPGDGWTITGIDITGASGQQFVVGADVDGVTLYDNTFNYSSSTGEALRVHVAELNSDYATRFALVETDFNSFADPNTAQPQSAMIWVSGEYVVWQGGTIDRNGLPSRTPGGTLPAPYTSRSLHQQHFMQQHTKWIRPYYDHVQFRADDSQRLDDYLSDNLIVLVSDNIQDVPSNQAGYGYRVCTDSSCACQTDSAPIAGPNGCAGQANSGHTVDVRDFIFERNTIRFSCGSPPTLEGRGAIFDLEGGYHTVRNNFVNYCTGQPPAFDGRFVIALGDPLSWTGNTVHGHVWVYNNTIVGRTASMTADVYTTQSYTGDGNTGCDTDCLDRNNLCVWTSALGVGGEVCKTVAAFTQLTPITDVDGTDPFDGTFPAEQTETMADIVPAAASAPVDAGTAQTDVYDDGRGLCRPINAVWDVGAIERGASGLCY